MIRKLDPKIKNHNRLKGPEEATLFQGKQQYELDVAISSYTSTSHISSVLFFPKYDGAQEAAYTDFFKGSS